MSTPTGDNAFLHELELTVRAELTVAETSLPEEQADGVPGDEWPSDPDVQRYDVVSTPFSAPSRPWKTPPAPATILRRPRWQRGHDSGASARRAGTGYQPGIRTAGWQGNLHGHRALVALPIVDRKSNLHAPVVTESADAFSPT